MTQPIRAALLAAVCALCAITETAHAYVTEGAVTIAPATLQPGALGDEERGFHLHFGSRPADIIVTTDVYRAGLGWYTQTLDVYADFKLSSPGEVLTQATFSAGVDPSQRPFGNPANGDDFYIAGMVDTGFLDPGEPSRPGGPDLLGLPHDLRFGWAHVHIDAGSREARVLSSAIAYGEGGIIVGTMQAVPEPGTAALSLLGLSGLSGLGALGRRARRQQSSLHAAS